MMHRPKKRSLTLDGHRTSVSIEEEFWHQFVLIARNQGKSINVLATEIVYDCVHCLFELSLSLPPPKCFFNFFSILFF